MKKPLLAFCYQAAFLLLFVLFLPKLLWQMGTQKKYRKSFFARLLGKKLTPSSKPVIWLHGVSVGETKALSTLLPHIKKSHPHAWIAVSTATETGQAEAEHLLHLADACFYLPFDFLWVIRRTVRTLRPDLLILVEGDFWYTLLNEVKKIGGKIALVNGKISKRSCQRYQWIKPFSKLLFQTIDSFCIQDETYKKRFTSLGIPKEKLHVFPSIKYDIHSKALNSSLFTFPKGSFVLTLGSTHEKEEEMLLKSILPLFYKYPHLHLLIAPRHPHRFSSVAALLQKERLSYTLFSVKQLEERIILIDKMGILPKCYACSDLAIVGGSFVKGIGGHDIFEPAKMGKPVFFGPYMQAQQALVQTITQAGAGEQVSLSNLGRKLEELLKDPTKRKQMGEKGKDLRERVQGSSEKTWNQICLLLELHQTSS